MYKVLKRVGYGSENTPLLDREYTLGSGCPVGTPKEIAEYYKNNVYTEIFLTDKDVKEIDNIIHFYTSPDGTKTYTIYKQLELFTKGVN